MKTKRQPNGLDKECKKYIKAKAELDTALKSFDLKFKETYDKFVHDKSEHDRLTLAK